MELMNLDRTAMREYFESLGEKSFRGDQVFKWIHKFGVTNFDEMSDLSKALREKLQEQATIDLPEMVCEQVSTDGTRKWLLQLKEGNCIETVYIPEEGRGTLCISSQVGCPLKCRFCTTGQQGFKRNLEISEIIGQVWMAVRQLSEDAKKHDRHVTNIVLMGMGEPLLNFDNVMIAINIMMDDLAYGLSKYRVTISTAGLVPEMDRLAQMSQVSLAVSLHAPNNELRSQLMPINKKYPLEKLLPVCKRFFENDKRRKVSFEYILIDHFNDQPQHARELVRILQGIPCKVNLIPYNPQTPSVNTQSAFRRSTPESIECFRNILMAAGINTITRKTRGEDIDAACGQLAGKLQ